MAFVHADATETAFDFTSCDTASLRAGVEATLSRMRAGEYGPREDYEPDVCGDCPALGGTCPVSGPPAR